MRHCPVVPLARWPHPQPPSQYPPCTGGQPLSQWWPYGCLGWAAGAVTVSAVERIRPLAGPSITSMSMTSLSWSTFPDRVPSSGYHALSASSGTLSRMRRTRGWTQGWAGIPVPGHSQEWRPLIPVPELWEWIFSFPSRSRTLGMEFFIPVPEPSKVIPAHPWSNKARLKIYWDGPWIYPSFLTITEW